jgi:hypothetical protein
VRNFVEWNSREVTARSDWHFDRPGRCHSSSRTANGYAGHENAYADQARTEEKGAGSACEE